MLPPLPPLRLLAVVALACLPLAAAGGGPQRIGADQRTLRYASQDDPQTLDPHAANLAVSSRVTGNVYEPLVWRDRDWKVIPWLATSWSRPDERTWRFRLREGVKFHDGSLLTADDEPRGGSGCSDRRRSRDRREGS